MSVWYVFGIDGYYGSFPTKREALQDLWQSYGGWPTARRLPSGCYEFTSPAWENRVGRTFILSAALERLGREGCFLPEDGTPWEGYGRHG